VLFDNVEKADASVFNLFLQIHDDGHVTDGKAAPSTSPTPSSS
jgi:ATP-dependent Clp protease ATP-binding subunit ClpA